MTSDCFTACHEATLCTLKADWDVSARDASETCFHEVEVYKLSLGSSQIYTYIYIIYIYTYRYVYIDYLG